MNTTQKIESHHYPPFRRASDRVRAVSRSIEKVEREHNERMRRMTLVLISGAGLLLVNALMVTALI